MEDKGLQAIKERLAAVTKGVWEVGVVREERSQATVWFNNESHAEVMNGNYLNNAEFIANAPTDMQALITEVERLREALEKIEKKTSDKSVKTIVQVTLDPTKYERHKNLGDPF